MRENVDPFPSRKLRIDGGNSHVILNAPHNPFRARCCIFAVMRNSVLVGAVIAELFLTTSEKAGAKIETFGVRGHDGLY